MQCARPRSYSDSQLNIIAELKDFFQHSWSQGQCDMTSIVKDADSKDGAVIVLVERG